MNFEERLNLAVNNDGRAKRLIAEAVGVHPPVLSRWLKGVHPDSHNVTKLASVLNVSVQWLLNGEGQMSSVSELESSVLREEGTSYGDNWMKRAIAAEKEVAALRHKLEALKLAFYEIAGPSDAMPQRREVQYETNKTPRKNH